MVFLLCPLFLHVFYYIKIKYLYKNKKTSTLVLSFVQFVQVISKILGSQDFEPCHD